MKKIFLLRFIHGLFAIYFISCVFYIYVAAVFNRIDFLLLVAVASLVVEGVSVFVLNKGDCPLIHIQRKIGDETPFFRLFLPENLAKKAVPFFTKLTWIGLGLVSLRYLFSLI